MGACLLKNSDAAGSDHEQSASSCGTSGVYIFLVKKSTFLDLLIFFSLTGKTTFLELKSKYWISALMDDDHLV